MSERVVEGIKDDPERYRVHISEINLITGGRLRDRVLRHTCSPIHGFIMVEREESEEEVELIPISSNMRIVIKEDEMSKANLGFYLGR